MGARLTNKVLYERVAKRPAIHSPFLVPMPGVATSIFLALGQMQPRRKLLLSRKLLFGVIRGRRKLECSLQLPRLSGHDEALRPGRTTAIHENRRIKNGIVNRAQLNVIEKFPDYSSVVVNVLTMVSTSLEVLSICLNLSAFYLVAQLSHITFHVNTSRNNCRLWWVNYYD